MYKDNLDLGMEVLPIPFLGEGLVHIELQRYLWLILYLIYHTSFVIHFDC